MQTARSFHVKSRWKSGWQNADEKCTRRKCGRTRVVRLLASWIRGIIPSTPCTPCAFLRSAHFFHHTSNKIRLVFQRKLSTTSLRHDRLTPFFFFFFNKSANFFQLFLSISYFIFFYLFTLIFPSKKKKFIVLKEIFIRSYVTIQNWFVDFCFSFSNYGSV